MLYRSMCKPKILYLSMNLTTTRKELCHDLEKSPTTIYNCLTKLIEVNIVEKFKYQKKKI